MKRTLSLILAAILSLSLVSAAAVNVFAASDEPHVSNPSNSLLKDYGAAVENELLYEAQFGLDYGCYQSHAMAIDSRRTEGELKVNDDKYGVTVEVPFKEGASNNTESIGKYWYGGIVEGLPLGEGYNYTIKYKIMNDNSGAGTGNDGFFFTSDAGATGTNVATSYGAYGNITKTTWSKYDFFVGGNHFVGKTLSSGSYIDIMPDGVLNPVFGTATAPVADEQGYIDMQVEINGYNYSLYIGDVFFDYATIPADKFVGEGTDTVASSLAVVFYTYSSGGGLKDVKIYKGCEHPESIITTAPPKTTIDPEDDTDPEDDETSAPDTTPAVVETTPAPATSSDDNSPSKTVASDETKAPDKTSGCGGVAVFAQLVAILGCGVVFATVVIRKKA